MTHFPWPIDCCGSESITDTFPPECANAHAIVRRSVDFPEPPFEFAAVMIGISYLPPIDCALYAYDMRYASLSYVQGLGIR